MGGICFAENISKEIEYFDYYLKIDHDYFPYGNKDLELLKKRLIYLVDNSKSPIIVIACNTLSSLIFHYNLNMQRTILTLKLIIHSSLPLSFYLLFNVSNSHKCESLFPLLPYLVPQWWYAYPHMFSY